MTKQLLFFGFLTAILSTPAFSEDRQKAWFVDKNFVYEHGHALSQEYIQKKAPEFSHVRERVLPWIVRIETQHSFIKNGFTSNHGTGIIIQGGFVVTAYHIFTKNIPADNKKIKVLLTMTDGRVFPATLHKHGPRDWALLKMTLPKDTYPELMQSPIVMREPVVDEATIFLGYPARLGIDKHGKVQSFHKGDQKKKIPTSQLEPMTVVASVSDAKAMTLKPLAGFPPVGGMSGGPILNIKGEVVAVQHGVTKTTENATGKILSYRIDATSFRTDSL